MITLRTLKTTLKEEVLFIWEYPPTRWLAIVCILMFIVLCFQIFYRGPLLQEELEKKDVSIVETAKERGCEVLFLEKGNWGEIRYKIFCEDGRVGFFTKEDDGRFTKK